MTVTRRGLWLSQLLHPEVSHVVAFGLTLSGPLDAERLHRTAGAVRRSGVIVRPYVGPTHLIPDSSDSVVRQSWTIDPNGPGYRAVCIR